MPPVSNKADYLNDDYAYNLLPACLISQELRPLQASSAIHRSRLPACNLHQGPVRFRRPCITALAYPRGAQTDSKQLSVQNGRHNVLEVSPSAELAGCTLTLLKR